MVSNSNLATKSVYALSAEEKQKTQRELEHQLMRSLAAYVALRSDDPICTVLEDLFTLEMQAAQFLGEAIPVMAEVKLQGALAGVLTVIPISTKGLPGHERAVVEQTAPMQIPASSTVEQPSENAHV